MWGKASVLGIRLEHVYLLGMDLKEKGEARDTKIRKVNEEFLSRDESGKVNCPSKKHWGAGR